MRPTWDSDADWEGGEMDGLSFKNGVLELDLVPLALLFGGGENGLFVYDIEGEWTRTETLTNEAYPEAAWSPDGSLVAIGDAMNGNVTIYDPVDWSIVTELSTTVSQIRQLAWSPDGSELAYGDNGEIHIHPAADWSNSRMIGTTNYQRTLSWSPDGSKIAHADSEEIAIRDAADGTDIARFTEGPSVRHKAGSWSPDGSLFAWGYGIGSDDPIYWGFVYDTSDWTRHARIGALSDVVHDSEFSPDGSMVAFASDANCVQVFDTSDWTRVKQIDTTSSVRRVAWNADGSMLAMQTLGNYDTFVHETDTWTRTHTLSDSDGYGALEWSPA